MFSYCTPFLNPKHNTEYLVSNNRQPGTTVASNNKRLGDRQAHTSMCLPAGYNVPRLPGVHVRTILDFLLFRRGDT